MGLSIKMKSVLVLSGLFLLTWTVDASIFHQSMEKYKSVEQSNHEEMLPESARLDLSMSDFIHPSKKTNLTACEVCKLLIDGYISLMNGTKLETNSLSDLFRKTCVDRKVQSEIVCKGIAEKLMPIIRDVFDSQKDLNSESFCGFVLQGRECEKSYGKFNWTIEIKNETKITEHKKLSKDDKNKNIKILHLTDIHYDPNYVVGSNAVCSEPVCCRTLSNPDGSGKSKLDISEDTGKPDSDGKPKPDQKENLAGIWGDYRNCDTPETVIDSALSYINKSHSDITYVYFTGDIVDHAIWSTSIEKNKNTIKNIMEKFRKNLPKNARLFPILGNHESEPLNMFAPTSCTNCGDNTKLLYELVAKEWNIGDDAKITIEKGGYYTVTPKDKFRIIALNNNDCYTLNLWILKDPDFPKEQLKWLYETLEKAENAKEYVHILMHIPSGEGCFTLWAQEFRKIVNRFHKTIGAIFNGHTHTDEFNIYYSNDNKYATNVAFNGGSLTQYNDVNSNYRIYTVEENTYQVLDHETYIFNLTEANANPTKELIWKKEYSFTEAYNVTSLSPENLDRLTNRLQQDKKLLRKYWEYKVKSGDSALRKGCDDHCLTEHLCGIVTTVHNDKVVCKKLTEIKPSAGAAVSNIASGYSVIILLLLSILTFMF